MKKYYLWMLAAVTALMCCTACGDDEDTPPTPPQPVPSVTLSGGTATDRTITFTVTPTDADRCAYRVLLQTAAAPDAATLFAEGTPVAADKPTQVPVDNLTPNTAYAVYAVAANGETMSEVKKLLLTTTLPDEPPIRIVELENTLLAYYYSEDDYENTGNFYFNLSRGEVDENGFPANGSDNYVLMVDLYSELPADILNPVLPDGTYVYSNVDKTRGTFFVNEAMGRGGPTFCAIENYEALKFIDGSIVFAHSGNIYTMTADFTTTEDEKIRFTYEGEMPFVNKDIPQGLDVTCTEAEAVWQGDLYGMGTSVWSMQIRDVSLTESGTPSGSGTLIDLVFFGEPFDSFEQAALTEGEYTFNNTFAIKTLMRGGKDGNNQPIGSIATKWNVGRPERNYLSDGTMTVSRSGDNYTITLDAVSDVDLPVKATYTGTIPMTSQVTPPDPGDYFSTLTHDVTIRPEDITYADFYDQEEWYEGSNLFQIVLSTDDLSLELDFYTGLDVEGAVPSGTFTVESSSDPTTYTPDPVSIQPGWSDGDGYNEGTILEIYDVALGFVKSGTVTVNHKGGYEYDITWDLVDDSPSGHRITGSYSGTLVNPYE